MHTHWIILLFASGLEAAFGYPHWICARIRHPVVWMGACITVLDKNFNDPGKIEAIRRILGGLSMGILLMVTLIAAIVIMRIGAVPELLAISALLASRSLYEHVHEVYEALNAHDIEMAREKVGRIVGRDVAMLNEAGVCRAAIESLAESFCDGVVAPFFWAACLGLPGIACYKAINTADSMIGHKDDRYRAYGWAAARLDDIANFIPARLSALLIVMAARSRNAWGVMRRDAGNHASPNAGWPEAAMAGALGLRLGGMRSYDGIVHSAAFIGDSTREATKNHLKCALRIYINACIMLWVILAGLWLIIVR